jgi:hypothetical protein
MEQTVPGVWLEYLGMFAGKPFTIPKEAKEGRFMLIVEPRRHEFLPLVLSNFCSLMCPLGWRLVVAHGSFNRHWLLQHRFFRPTNPEDIVWIDLDHENLTLEQYNALLLSFPIWTFLHEGLGCRDVLIFQVDTLLLRPERIDTAFAGHYGFVGAPWQEGYMDEYYPGLRVGNGGLSLRNVPKMLQYLARIPTIMVETGCCAEDACFSIAAQQDPTSRMPTIEEASEFAVETVLVHPDPCGFHKAYKFHDCTEIIRTHLDARCRTSSGSGFAASSSAAIQAWITSISTE